MDKLLSPVVVMYKGSPQDKWIDALKHDRRSDEELLDVIVDTIDDDDTKLWDGKAGNLICFILNFLQISATSKMPPAEAAVHVRQVRT